MANRHDYEEARGHPGAGLKAGSTPSLASQVWYLVRKELLIEWRTRYALNGILLYLLAVVFLIYLSFERLDGILWILLFWITMLFAAANAIAKSFVQEGPGRHLYYYTLVSPQAVILAKMGYNWGLMLLLSVLGLGLYTAVAGWPVRDVGPFLAALFVGGAAFALLFSMVSAIAGKAANTGTLMTVLAFPILIPVLRLLVGVTAGTLESMPQGPGWGGIVLIFAIDILIVALAAVLFPYLWRD